MRRALFAAATPLRLHKKCCFQLKRPRSSLNANPVRIKAPSPCSPRKFNPARVTAPSPFSPHKSGPVRVKIPSPCSSRKFTAYASKRSRHVRRKDSAPRASQRPCEAFYTGPQREPSNSNLAASQPRAPLSLSLTLSRNAKCHARVRFPIPPLPLLTLTTAKLLMSLKSFVCAKLLRFLSLSKIAPCKLHCCARGGRLSKY